MSVTKLWQVQPFPIDKCYEFVYTSMFSPGLFEVIVECGASGQVIGRIMFIVDRDY